MIITCPSCRTSFQTRPGSLGEAGRMVRCSSCGQRWFAKPPAQVATEPAGPAPPAPAEAEVEAPTLPPVPAAEPAVARRSPLLGWLVATLVVLLLAAFVAGRNEIAAQFPATVPLYQRLGLPIRLPLGVEFRQLSSVQRMEQGRRLIAVSGEIANVSGQQRVLPPIRVALLDGDYREIDFGVFDPPQPSLEPGALARFEVALGEPSAEARNFSVTFGELP
jgi:predicted Zn finger-like uncharacterized protein